MLKKIKWISLLIAVLMLFTFTISQVKVKDSVVKAETASIDYEKNIDATFKFELYDDGYYITEYLAKGNISYLEIPDYYNGKRVTGIKDNIVYDSQGVALGEVDGVFKGQKFTKIDFGSNLNYIGRGAFESCENLTEIEIPENVKRIHHKAFFNCKNLVKVNLPQLEYLGNDVLTGTKWQSDKIEKNKEDEELNSALTTSDKNKKYYDNEIYYEEENNLMLLKVLNLADLSDGDAKYMVKQGTRLVASQMFDYDLLYGIKKIIFPNSVKFIGSAQLGASSDKTSSTTSEDVSMGVSVEFVNENGNLLLENEKNEYLRQLFLEEYTFARAIVKGVVGTKIDTDANGKVEIPSGTIKITKRAFQTPKKTQLKQLYIPSSVEYIGVEAFKNCDNLTTVVFLGGNVVLDKSVFEGCDSLTTIVGLEYVTQIGDSAFKNCKNLNNIALGNVNILSNAFYSCGSLLNIEQKPDTSTKSIGLNAFFGTALYNSTTQGFVYVSDFIIKYNGQENTLNIDKNIADYALASCKAQSITIAPNVVIGKGALSNCINLQSVNINENSIPSFCFYNSGNLSQVIGAPTNVGEFAFANTKINSIDLTLTEQIKDYAFYNTMVVNLDVCKAQLTDYALFGIKSLQTINATDNEKYVVENGLLYTQNKQKLICCPPSSGLESLNLNNVVIGKGAFAYCESGLEINGIVSQIEERAFYEANVVYNATGTKKVGYKSFYGAKTQSLILNDLEHIGDKAFCYLQNLTNLELTTSDALPLGVLKGCMALKDLKIGFNFDSSAQENYSHFGYVFGLDYYSGAEPVNQVYKVTKPKTYYMPNIENIEITSGVFESVMALKSLKTITLSGNAYVETYAFANCTELTNVYFSQGVTSISKYAFYNCTNLKGLNSIDKINLEGITYIGEKAFAGCTSIEQVDIKQGLTAEGLDYSGVFVNCKNLKTINIYSEEFFNIDNDSTIYGNLFDKATTVMVGDKQLSQEEIADLKTLKGANITSDTKTLSHNPFVLAIIIIIGLGAILLAISSAMSTKNKIGSREGYSSSNRHHHSQKFRGQISQNQYNYHYENYENFLEQQKENQNTQD